MHLSTVRNQVEKTMWLHRHTVFSRSLTVQSIKGETRCIFMLRTVPGAMGIVRNLHRHPVCRHDLAPRQPSSLVLLPPAFSTPWLPDSDRPAHTGRRPFSTHQAVRWVPLFGAVLIDLRALRERWTPPVRCRHARRPYQGFVRPENVGGRASVQSCHPLRMRGTSHPAPRRAHPPLLTLP